MTKLIALIVSIALTAGAGAQESVSKGPATVTVASKGHDVRAVLHDMFKQAGKSFVLEPNIRFGLFLSLEKVEFEEALRLICRIASLEIDVQNGIYFINKPKTAVVTPGPTAVKGAFETKPKGRLSESVLNKRITTRSEKLDLKSIMADLAKQTGLSLEIDGDVPTLRLDAYLLNTSLKFALDTICAATKLQFRFTDNLSIQIFKPAAANRVTVVGG